MQNNGFELLRDEWVEETNSHARLYRHQKTGAQVLSLENDDENKVFGITFRTPPKDSSGLPHIMEHSVLCGSRKYRVKEPFVELMKGSLNTFLNAFTYPDHTCYPVASQNLRDFYNLVDVYLDAVFYPLIPEETLMQEGWHYEVDELGKLSYKGVVFNEMKGAYSSPEALLYKYSQQALFPDNTYGVDSGGDPQVIPDLTYEQFKDFHETYYHPSNALIYFSGDDPVEERLRILDTYLSAFDARPVDSQPTLQMPFDAPRRNRFPYEAGEDAANRKHFLTVNWMIGQAENIEQVIGLDMLGYILAGTAASPLRKALIDSGLGEGMAGAGMETDLRQMYYSTGMKGIDAGKLDTVEKLIISTLETLADQGVDGETIEAALNTIEFRLRENNTGSFPRGLLTMLRALGSWLYDGDPLEPLRYAAPLASIRARFEGGEKYFEGLIRKYILDNPHRVTVELYPDEQLAMRQAQTEQKRLDAIAAQLQAAEIDGLRRAADLLRERQERADTPEALAAIPSLTLEDIDRQVRVIPRRHSDLRNGVQPDAAHHSLMTHDLFTNGILYLDLGFDMAHLPADLLPYSGLFGRALLEMGTRRYDYVQLIQRIGQRTGGIGASSSFSATRQDAQGANWLFVRSKATLAQVDDLLELLDEILLNPRLDERERFRQIVMQAKAGMESSLAPAGHRYVNTRLRARFTRSDWASEQTGGVSGLFFLRRLLEQIDSDWPAVQARLEALRKHLVNRHHLIVNATLDGESWASVDGAVRSFANSLPGAPIEGNGWQGGTLPEAEGLIIPAQVYAVGMGYNLYKAGYDLHGSVHVIAHHLRTTYLWDRVRVQGGAYGGFCSWDSDAGVMTYLSYRDPNLLPTLDVYRQTGDFLRRLEIEQEELTKSIIGVIGDFDSYQLPDAKGFSDLRRYLNGIDDAHRQRIRDEVLSTTVADFRRFAEVLDAAKEQAAVVVMGPGDGLQNAADKTAGMQIQRVL